MVSSAAQAAVRLQKTLSVRRSTTDVERHWWSLPFSLKQFSQVFHADLRAAEAIISPGNALDAVDAALLALAEDQPDSSGGVAVEVQVSVGLMQSKQRSPSVLRLADVAALLDLADSGRVAPCRITIERQGGSPLFTIQVPERHAEQLQYCFHRRGDAVRALASLTLGRGLGTDPVGAESDLLRHEDFADAARHSLQLVLEKGGARLEGLEDGGRRRVCYLESGRGYQGSSEVRSRWQVWRESWREDCRRFPVKVILFAGLPVFIGMFRAAGALLRRIRP